MGFAGFAVVFWAASSAKLLDSFYASWSAAAALALSLLGAMNMSWLGSKFFWIFSLPGKYSYGNYLFHTTVLYFLSPRLMGGNIYLTFMVFAATSTAVAALSFHFFETPANRWIRRKFHAV
jgi:peptidoglycan/LPS O-acetylase OafA/YrhL